MRISVQLLALAALARDFTLWQHRGDEDYDVDASLSCCCHFASYNLLQFFKDAGLEACLMVGFFKTRRRGPLDHCWVEIRDHRPFQIVDLTARQFDEKLPFIYLPPMKVARETFEESNVGQKALRDVQEWCDSRDRKKLTRSVFKADFARYTKHLEKKA